MKGFELEKSSFLNKIKMLDDHIKNQQCKMGENDLTHQQEVGFLQKNYEKSLDTHKDRIRQLDRTVMEVEGTRKDLERQIQDFNNRNHDLEKNNLTLGDTLSETQGELENLIQDHQNVLRQREHLNQSLLKQEETQASIAKQALTTKRLECEQLDRQLSELRQEHEQLHIIMNTEKQLKVKAQN